MKKFILISTLLAATFIGAAAQDYYSVQTISNYRYHGTARSMAMGNAVTAIGGDLGMITVNPAGAAVAPYSQVTVTPGVTISSSSSRYAATYSASEGLKDSDFGSATRDNYAQFILPNIGFNLYFNTGREYGVQGITFGFICNATSNNIRSETATGLNNETSLLGSLGYWASGVPQASYLDANAYNNYDLGFFSVMAAKTGMIKKYNGIDCLYQGVTEITNSKGDLVTAGPLYQKSVVAQAGYRCDMAINLGMKVSDDWFFGVNIGMPRETTSYQESFLEAAEKASDYPEFDNASYTYGRRRGVSGVYGKFGIIWAPKSGIRFGAAFQTPTSYTVTEDYTISGQCTSRNGASLTSYGQRDNSYCLRSPYMANFGIAYVIGAKALVSVDYELADYGVTRYRLVGGRNFDNTEFAEANTTNKLFYGMQHNLRAGVEFKVIPSVAVRAGYNLQTSPMRYYTNATTGATVTPSNFDYSSYNKGALTLTDKKMYNSNAMSYSLGAGWSSGAGFFCDIVVRLNTATAQDFVPYRDYIFSDGAITYPTPTVRTIQRVWDAALTIGWRF